MSKIYGMEKELEERGTFTRKDKQEKEELWTFTSEDKQPLQQRGQTPFPIAAMQWLLHQWTQRYLSQLFKSTLMSTPYHVSLFNWSSNKNFGGVALKVHMGADNHARQTEGC